MQLLYVIIFVIASLYFLLKKRNFDLYTVAFFSAIIYFLPGLYGYTLHPTFKYEMPLVNGTYQVMILIILVLFISTIIYDSLVQEKKLKKINIEGTEFTLNIILAIGFISFLIMLATTGDILFTPNKSMMMTELNRWHFIWTTATILGLVISFIDKKYIIFGIFLIFSLINIFIGFRSSTAIAFISIYTFWQYNKGKQRYLLQNKKGIFVGLLFALFFFSYKHLYIDIKSGEFDSAKEKIFNYKFYLESINNSEPFTTQSILNEVINNSFYVGMEHLSGIVYQILPSSSAFGVETVVFNDLYQTQLFPYERYGLASNIWAEMISSGGAVLLIVFSIIFSAMIVLGNLLLNTKNSALLGLVLILSTYWVFYIHRNDVIYQITLEKRVFLVWIISYLIAYIFYMVKFKVKGNLKYH